MRKVFIDENLSPLLAKPLEATYRQDRFLTCEGVHLSGTDDLDLFPMLRDMDVEMIVTKDFAQLDDAEERDGLASAGLHWLGVPEIKELGAVLIAQQLATVVPAVGLVLRDWPDDPTAYTLAFPQTSPFARVTRLAL